jgi:hypothetical protein
MPFVEGSEQPEEDFKTNSGRLEAPGLNYNNGSPDLRLTLIRKPIFASYRVVGSQLPTVAGFIRTEGRCVQTCCCSFATFMVFCWTTETGTSDWPNHRWWNINSIK